MPSCLARTPKAVPGSACDHLTCRVSDIYDEYIRNTRSAVRKWAVDVAAPGTTDRLALTIFQPGAVDPQSRDLFEYVIRANMHRLGPRWGLQIMYGTEADRHSLDEALGRPPSVIWTPLVLNGTRRDSINKHEANWFRLHPDFWRAVDEKHENVLIFESDSLVLKGHGCVDQYVGYDLVGAPWPEGTAWGRRVAPMIGGNGGFTLRRRSTNLIALRHRMNKKNVNAKHIVDFPWNEDGEIMWVLPRMSGLHYGKGPQFPERQLALKFAVERIYTQGACGFHNPWEFLTEQQARELLAGADWD